MGTRRWPQHRYKQYVQLEDPRLVAFSYSSNLEVLRSLFFKSLARYILLFIQKITTRTLFRAQRTIGKTKVQFGLVIMSVSLRQVLDDRPPL